MSDYAISLIRTYVPVIVGAVLAWLGSISIFHPLIAGMSYDQKTAIYGAITAAVIGVYYTVVRGLERKFPQVGVLLGKKAEPVYSEPAAPAAAPAAAPLAAVPPVV